MRSARLLEAGLLAIGMALLAVSIWIAHATTWLVAIPLFLALLIALSVVIYRYDAWLVRRLSPEDEPLVMALCKTGFVGRVRNITRVLPSAPRCRICLVPFGGVGRFLGIRPSLKNPNFCQSCFEGLPARTFDMDVGVLFADMRGFTAWSEDHSASEVAAMLTRFYDVASRELARDDALMEFIGDEVMALYPVEMPSLGSRTADVMFDAARRLVPRVKADPAILDVGVGLTLGLAQVGSIAMGQGKDFTAVGDVVNTASRLQSEARANEILFSENVLRNLDHAGAGTEREQAGDDLAPVHVIRQPPRRQQRQRAADDRRRHHHPDAAAFEPESAAHQGTHGPERAGDQTAEEGAQHGHPRGAADRPHREARARDLLWRRHAGEADGHHRQAHDQGRAHQQPQVHRLRQPEERLAAHHRQQRDHGVSGQHAAASVQRCGFAEPTLDYHVQPGEGEAGNRPQRQPDPDQIEQPQTEQHDGGKCGHHHKGADMVHLGDDRGDEHAAHHEPEEIGGAAGADGAVAPAEGLGAHGQQAQLQTVADQQDGHREQQRADSTERLGHGRLCRSSKG